MKTKLLFCGFLLLVFFISNAVAQNPWSQGADMPTARGAHTVALANGLIYAVGGVVNDYPSSIIEAYDPATDTWVTKTAMPTARQDFSGCGLNGKIYAIGGWRFLNFTFSKIEEYDPATDTWETKAPMPTARWGHATCSVDGKIYVIGGAKGWPVEIIHETIEVYDPLTDTWETKASIPTPRWSPSSSVVDGLIYVIGGCSDGESVPTVEVYDPATDTWATETSMPTARWGLACAAVNGKIYAIGGANSHPVTEVYNTVEEYDPVMNTWTTRTPMPADRYVIAACSVDDKIYIPGGGGATPGVNFAEIFIYNPENELGIDDNINALNLKLHQNYPNPFNILTSIEYELREPGIVSLSVYDYLGHQIVTLISQHQQIGKYQALWNAQGQPPGIYFYRLQAGDQTATGKMVLMK